jgi:hypothetical protein
VGGGDGEGEDEREGDALAAAREGAVRAGGEVEAAWRVMVSPGGWDA